MRVNSIIQDSIVDGTGLRLVVFMQGCKRYCAGCHNPSTWDFDGGFEIDADMFMYMLRSNQLLDGITFTGGEPFQQVGELERALVGIKDKSVWVYTGYTFEELLEKCSKNKLIERCLNSIDVLVDGPYIHEQRTLAEPFKGSSNQRIIDVQESLRRGEVVLYEVV